MKFVSGGKWFVIGALASACVAVGAVAQENQPATSAPAPAPANSSVAGVLKMLDAGVSKDVIKAYIANAPAGFNVTASDLIALKQRGVGDDIAMNLLSHTAPVRSQPAAASQASAVTQRVVVANSGYIDPESYAYFQRYYLYPRTLANVYQTLGYSPYGYGPYGYGPGVSFAAGFGPRRGFVRGGAFIAPGW